MANTTKAEQTAMEQKFIAAFTKYFVAKTKITVNGTAYTPAQITAVVQSRVTAETEVIATRGSYSQAVAEAKVTVASTKALFEGAKQFVLVTYGNQAAVLSEFGLAAKKVPAPIPVAEKKASIDQRLATRAARHTMGAQQKKKVKGVVAAASSDASVPAPAALPSTVNVGPTPTATAAAALAASATATPSGGTGH